jgi:adenine-specific DNA-methyltransferase
MVKAPKNVEVLSHNKARRINVPTAELQSLADQQEELAPRPPEHYARARALAKGQTRDRNSDLDPQIVWNGVKISLTREQLAQLTKTGTIEIGDAQLVWRGKDRQDWSDLVVSAPMLYVQEKVHPKAIIDELKRQTNTAREQTTDAPDLFADFNGLADPEARAEFYQHSMHWQNRMILGDSLQVMASLAEREALRGKVQCIYFDPPYGIKFNSNWQVSTLSRDVKDGKAADISREPEQVKAFRDTWKDSIHSYLTYLRDRLTVARELLTESGSIFVQIGDENVHRARAVMDEVFGAENICAQIVALKTSGQTSELIAGTADYMLWYSKQKSAVKFRNPLTVKGFDEDKSGVYRSVRSINGSVCPLSDSDRANGKTAGVFTLGDLTSQRPPGSFPIEMHGRVFGPGKGYWKTGELGISRLKKADRIGLATNSLRYVRFLDDFRAQAIGNVWSDTGTGSFTDQKIYVVQTGTKVVQRCILMTTDPGDIVLDPTCGSGTTAAVAEQWGRRWITIDTSRVAMALARTRLMSARYPFYLLADSHEGRAKEQEITSRVQPDTPTHKDIRQGFIYERVPHITLKSIANNAEIDVIWEKWQRSLEPLRAALNARLRRSKPWEEWQIPRTAGDPWVDEAIKFHAAARAEDATDKKRLGALASQAHLHAGHAAGGTRRTLDGR